MRAAIRPETKLIWCESPTNPLLGIADIAALAGVAHDAGARLVVDNTFATPYLQNPLSLGADIVLHSTTKYLGGHSDVVGGAIVTNEDELREQFFYLRNAAGAVPGPFDAWLTLRGIKTLALRMERHSDNAELVVAGAGEAPEGREGLLPGPAGAPGPRGRRRSRCAASAGWCRSATRTASRPRWTWRRARSCSSWPSRSAASSR